MADQGSATPDYTSVSPRIISRMVYYFQKQRELVYLFQFKKTLELVRLSVYGVSTNSHRAVCSDKDIPRRLTTDLTRVSRAARCDVPARPWEPTGLPNSPTVNSVIATFLCLSVDTREQCELRDMRLDDPR